MIVSEIKLYNLLKAKIGDQEAEAFLQILEERVDKKFAENREILSTKEDLSKMEARLTMRMFLSWIGQLGAFVAIVKYLL